jgi:hypothetical protein
LGASGGFPPSGQALYFAPVGGPFWLPSDPPGCQGIPRPCEASLWCFMARGNFAPGPLTSSEPLESSVEAPPQLSALMPLGQSPFCTFLLRRFPLFRHNSCYLAWAGAQNQKCLSD